MVQSPVSYLVALGVISPQNIIYYKAIGDIHTPAMMNTTVGKQGQRIKSLVII